MKEKHRQDLLKSGKGITRKALLELIEKSWSESWSGCMTGADWSGTRIYVPGARHSNSSDV